MIVGGKFIGVFDVQSDVVGRFTDSDIAIQTTLAAQVASSIQNALQVQESRKLQEQYTLAIEGANDGIWDWNVVTNQVFFSPRWKEMIGYREDELNNGFADFEALLHPEDHDRALETVNNYLTGKIPAYDLEFRFRHKNGSYRWIRARGKALRDENGAPFRMAGSHTDITEGKAAQENISQRARQQEAINLITQKIQSATTVESALQVTARELGHALGMKSTLVELNPATPAGEQKENVND
jgi:PAS domain S-box-containing protein